MGLARGLGSATLVLWLVLPALAAGPKSVDERCLECVKGYADAMIEHGRDTYGAVQSPLFAAALDRKTLRVFEKMPPGLPDIRNSDRTYNGANPMLDLNFYQVLYALSQVTGDERDAREADAAIKWFFEHCQSPKGLMGWGEHQGWSFLSDAPSAPAMPHEFYRPWILWDRSWSLAPEACHRFAVGLWEHQIGDQSKGLFSRHAENVWDQEKKSGRTGHEFPRHGGFYLATWAADYQRTKDSVMLRAIETLLDGFLGRRHPTTGAIPSQTSIPDLMWTASNVSLAIDLWDAAGKVPDPLARKMRDAARQIDEVNHRIAHEPGPGGKGFVKSCHTSTLEPGDERASTKSAGSHDIRFRPYTEIWATGYGVSVHAEPAMLCLVRYRQVQDERYQKLFLDTAETYLAADPPLEPSKDEHGKLQTPVFYPGALGEVIALETAAYRLTGAGKYLDRAEHFADLAMNIFFTPDSPLPRVASPPNFAWYEAITRADTLAMSLLDFWAAKAQPELKLPLEWTDR